MENLKNYIESIISSTDWNVSFYNKGNNAFYVCFQIYTSAGRDLNVEIELPDDAGEDELSQKLTEYDEGFDVSYETYIWLDSFGHGKNGAPHELEDVLNDTKEAKRLIEELAESFA